MRRSALIGLIGLIGLLLLIRPAWADELQFAPAVREAGRPILGAGADYDDLLAAVGSARIVMLGEATHGSREFYRQRARITRRLIEEQGFTAVVLEAPWEPVRRLDAYGRGEEVSVESAFSGFTRFPRWMWRNAEMRDFLEDLRRLNSPRAPESQARLYGMDLYSVPESADAVVRQVARRSIAAAALARQRYACFDHHLVEPQRYGRDVEAGRASACSEGARQQLAEMTTEMTAEMTTLDEDDFNAWQSARVVSNGENYYRAMYRSGVSSWNLREQHMADTLHQLLARLGPAGKMVVWAQNIHQGDARATDQAALGELSLGQLLRERHGADAFLVGFATDHGTVRAARGWGAPDRVWRLRPALAESWSGLLRRVAMADFYLIFRGNAPLAELFSTPRLERAVGVAYLPHDERPNHYFNVRLSQQFDAVIFLGATSAVEPLP